MGLVGVLCKSFVADQYALNRVQVKVSLVAGEFHPMHLHREAFQPNQGVET